jgi:hypothetical protein
VTIPVIRLRFSNATPKIRARVLPGIPPLQAAFRNNGTAIQWRVGGTGAWTDIVPLIDITGPVAEIMPGTGIAVDSTDTTKPVVSLGVAAVVRNYIDAPPYVASRTALKAIDTTKDTVAYLTEAGREGIFVWRTGDYSTQVTADTQEGVYIASTGTASTSGAWVRKYDGLPQGNWFGADASASDNATAFSGIASVLSLLKKVALPAGVFITSLATASLPAALAGPGQVQDTAGNRGPIFMNQTAAPSALGNQNSVLTAFNGDLSRVGLAMEKRTTGSSTLGTPTTGYVQNPETSALFISGYNSSGHNEATASNDGRTGASLLDLRLTNAGQGDYEAIFVSGFVTGSRSGATSFLANPAASAIAGQLNAGADGVYLNVIELNANDNGYAAAAIGEVFNYTRTNTGATLGQVWMGTRHQSIGSSYADVAFSPVGNWKRGLDLTPITMDSDKAGITMQAGQRLYLNSSSSGTIGWSQTVGTEWIDYASSAIRLMVGSSAILAASSSAVTLTQPLVLPADPTTSLQAATKQYVDNVAVGLDVKPSVKYATTAALATNTYAAGVLTATANGALTVDGGSPALNDRVLVKNEATAANNGIYYLSQVGDGTHPYKLTRVLDMDAWTEVPGANVWVEQGTANADTAWVCTADQGGTIGSTAIAWTQFGGTGAYQAASATLTAFAAYNTNGLMVQTAANTFTGRTLAGTSAEITVTNGDGVSGAPTFSLPTALTFTGKTVTGGTFNIDALTVASSTTFLPQVAVRNGTNDANGAYFMVRKSRGVSNTAVQVGDTLGTFMFQGWDSSGTPILRNAAYLASVVETVSVGAVNAKFQMVAGSQIVELTSNGGHLTTPSGGLLRLGGSTSSQPALKASSAVLQARLADDSAFAAFSAELLNAAAGTATPAGGSTAARLLLGTTSGFGIYFGSGAPTVSAGQGSIYLRSDGLSTSTRLYVNTNGSTTWTNVTTAA